MTNQKSSFTIKQKEQLKKKINNLDYNEQCEIFNIIRKDTDKISENNNGVFINLKYIKDETIDKLISFVDYCEKNKDLMKKGAQKYEDEIINTLLNYDSISENSKSTSTVIKSNTENLSECYNSYTIENDYLDVMKKQKEEDIIDKFSFKTYIDKLSVTSQKTFQTIDTDKKIPFIKTKKLRLVGVKARIMKKCRNINKNINFCLKSESDKKKKIEHIISDNMSELDKLSNISDDDNYIDDESFNDESFNDKISYISNELTEEFDFVK